MCLLLVCESVTRHLANIGPWMIMVPKSGHVTITKIEKLHIDTHVEKFTDSKNAIVFDLRKITKLSRKIRFRNSGVIRRVRTLGRLELTLVVNTSF